MDQLIPVVNKLQDIFGAIGSEAIDLPQIVVVGSQSSGKSSVLENIVGRDFLPRGSGIVTRRPLVLQLYSISKGSASTTLADGRQSNHEEWGEFLHLPGKKYYDFTEIRAEIARETDRVTGKNKGISNKSINLKIYSPFVLNLTLVDLPGITKVPTGDQPEDVEDQIRNMCLEFISNPNAIILAVTAANQDLVNSDGLKMARSVDPEGDRTIGVLTKVDIMDAGTDCSDILANRVVPLKRGYVAVVNRSQKDIQEGLPIRQGLTKELAFFQSHPKYRSSLSKCGTVNLSRTLNQILMHHIRDCLPDIKLKINKMMSGVIASLEALGDAGDFQNNLGPTLLRIISKFATNVTTSIDGKTGKDGSIEMTELYGGARISFIFTEIFGRLLWDMNPFEGLDDEDIRTAIANANGTRPSLFVPEISFDLLVRRQIARLEAPGLQCVDMIFDEMQRLSYQCETPELIRFPILRERVFEIVSDMLRQCVKPTQKMISSLVQIELAYINTSHPDFIGGKQALAQVTKKAPSSASGITSAEASSGTLTSGNVMDNSTSPQPANGMNQSAVSSSSGPMTPINTSQVNTLTNVSGMDRNTPVNANLINNSAANSPAPAGFFGLFRPPMTPTGPPTSIIASESGRSSDGNMNISSSGTVTPPYPPVGNANNVTVRTSTRYMRTPTGVTTTANTSTNSYNQNGLYNSRERDTTSLVKLPQMPDRMKLSSSSTNDWGRREVEIIKTLISSYFDVVRKSYVDLVPKTVMHFLVNGFRENLQNELVAHLYRENMMQDLMRETDDVAAKRKSCLEMKDLLQKALDIVNEVRDYKPTK